MVIVNFGLINGDNSGVFVENICTDSFEGVSEMIRNDQGITKDVQVSGQTDVAAYITKMALEELYERSEDEMYRYRVTPRWLPGTLTQSTSDEIIDLQLKSNIERYTVFEVAYMHRNRRQTVEIQLSVEIERQLPVASKRIMNGEMIESGDLEMRWISVPHDRGQLVSDEETLIGKTIRRTLVQGQPIRYADISSDLLVEAGDEVQLIFENEGIQIQITVEARQSGAQDEEISFYSHETRRSYRGKISGPGVAIWTRTI